MTAPLQIPAFRRLIAAYAINTLGTWLGEIALAVLVLEQTGSPAAVASVWVLGLFVPSLVGSWFVTRFGTGPRVLGSLLALEAVLFAALAALAASFSLFLILALVTADGVLALSTRALTKASIVAVTQRRGLLREGNAVLTTVFTSAMAIGPILGGVVVGFASPQVALAIDAISFALAAAVVAHAGVPRAASTATPAAGRMRDALAYVRAQPALRRLLAAGAAVTLLGSMVLPLEVVLVTDDLGGSEAAYGTVLALWGGGSVAGSALLPALRRVPLRLLMAGSFVIYAGSYLGMGTAGSIEAVGLFSLVGGVANGVEIYATLTAVQEATSPERQASVAGFFEAIVSGGAGAGFLLGGTLAAIASTRSVYVVAGLGILLLSVLVLAWSRSAAPAMAPARLVPSSS
ncbi:MAG TPA: MFS transporter [Thermoleophilaceae bacterium]